MKYILSCPNGDNYISDTSYFKFVVEFNQYLEVIGQILLARHLNLLEFVLTGDNFQDFIKYNLQLLALLHH